MYVDVHWKEKEEKGSRLNLALSGAKYISFIANVYWKTGENDLIVLMVWPCLGKKKRKRFTDLIAPMV